MHTGFRVLDRVTGISDTEVGPESGVNVSERVHPPEVGEVGHGGRYISAMAITYPTSAGGESAASNTSRSKTPICLRVIFFF